MSTQRPPLVEFPCRYPIKVIGDTSDDFERMVADIVERHDPHFERDSIQCRPSRNGRFLSASVVIQATGEPQLKALFQDLKATGRVRMVL